MASNRSHQANRDALGDEEPQQISSQASDRPDHPVSALQRRAGNQAVAQLIGGRAEAAEGRDDGVRADARVDGPPSGSTGRPLNGETRRRMERALDAGFGDVRIHEGVAARTATRRLDAAAFATDSDVVLRTADTATGDGRDRFVLAHELAHVAQFQQSGSERATEGVTSRAEAAEREATNAAGKAVAGESARVTETPSGSVATLGFGWLEEGAEAVGSAASSTVSSVGSAAKSAGSAVGSAAQSAGSTIASGASSAWEGAKNAGSSVASGLTSAASWAGDAASTAYGGMQTASGAIMEGGKWLEGKIDAGQDWLSGTVQSAADMAEGIPVLEQVADAGAWTFDTYTGLQAGILQGATSFGSGLAGMVANPVDAAKGLFSMGKHIPTGIGALNPFKSAEAGYDVLAGNASLGEAADRLSTPGQGLSEDAEFWKNVGSGFASDYQRSIGEDEDYAQAVGRGVLDIGSLFLGGSGAAVKGGATAGKVANVAGKASRSSRIARTASTAGKFDEAAQAASRAGRADEAAKAAQMTTDDALRVSGRSADDLQSRITASTDEALTTQQAMSRSPPISAGNQWVKHNGQWVRRSGNSWRNKQGRYAKGPYSIGGAGKSTPKSLDDIIKRAESDYQMGAREAEDFLNVTGKSKSGKSRMTEEWRAANRPGNIEKHHLVPQEFLDVPQVRQRLSEVIKSKRSTPEDFVHQQLAGITKQKHMRLDKAGYAADWAKWFKQNPQFTKSQLQAKIRQMMTDFEIPASARNMLRKYGRN